VGSGYSKIHPCTAHQINLALTGSCTDTRVLTAIRHYAITGDRLRELAIMVERVLQTVRSSSRETSGQPDIRTLVMECMAAGDKPEGLPLKRYSEWPRIMA